MNVKNLLLLLTTLTGLGTGCTDDVEGGGSQTSGIRSEIQIEMKGTSESEEYSKAIASESENLMKDLKIYLFAAASQAGPYYYLETWEEGTAYDPQTPAVTKFQKQTAGTSLKASIYPNELVGLPYVQLMCIANHKSSNTLDGKFFQVNGTTELPTLVPVTTNAAGDITNANAATKVDAFIAAYTRKMLNTEPGVKDVIGTPLLMSGNGQTKISGSVSKVNITMRRAMARFDIDNTKSKSNLTIQTVTLANARPTSSIWNVTPQTLMAPETHLMTYAPVDYTAKENANLGMTESAIYVYPGLEADKSYLIVTGTYKSPVTTQEVPVTYNVPIQRTVAQTTEYIDIKANSRYKLKITDVTQAALYGTFEVEDWTSGGGIQIKPDNDAPVFDPATGFTAEKGTAPVAIADSKTMFVVDENSEFTTTIAATGKVRAEKAVATKTVAPDWLTIAEPPTYKEENGVWYSTFKMTVNNATGELPVAVTFINEAASYDPDLWTVLTLYGPKAKPALETGGEGSLGNTVDYEGLTANMYNVVGSTIKVKAMCIEGTKLVLPDEFEEVEGERVTEGYYTTFTIRVKKTLTDTNTYDVKFQNGEDNATETVLIVTAVKAGLSVSLGNDAATYADLAGTTVKTDIDLLSTHSYTLLIAAPQGADVTLPSDKWLNIAVDASKTKEGVLAYTVSRNASVSDYADFDLEFTNKLNTSEKLTVTMNKAFSKPIFATATAGDKSDFNTAPTITDYAPTANMYLANGSKIAIKVTCPEEMSFLEKTTTGLTISDKGEGNYEVEVNDAAQFTAGGTTEVVAQNTTTGADDRNATLTITWVSPEIKIALTPNAAVEEATEGKNIVYTVYTEDLPGKGFNFTATAPKGASANFSAMTTWLIKNVGSDTVGANAAETYTIKGSGETADTNDISVTFTNTIANGGDKTIVFKYQTTKP
ncbi:hypothetical protein [Parabacteroides gordonii]|uniref:hypothetical protein n=1 Tax=Parabacteroides gordonii TaxID=574930 RepID=UPI0026EF58E8|nr:hypothetical protein [Parabacteroides gordonii]